MSFEVGDRAGFSHPAGPVRGTITEVNSRAVCLRIPRDGGKTPQEPLDLWFTLRDDGSYRQMGKGKFSPQLRRLL